MDSNRVSEEEIIQYIENSKELETDKVLSARFNVTESYIKSLKWRIKRQKSSKEVPKPSKA